jgi:toxin secretion/phage lysis holin
MKDIWGGIQMFFAAAGAWFGWFFGGLDGFIYALIAFVIIDYITGLMAAGVEKSFSSEIGFKGICRKILIFMFVGIGNIIDWEIIGDGIY